MVASFEALLAGVDGAHPGGQGRTSGSPDPDRWRIFSCRVLLSTGCTRSLSTRSVQAAMSTGQHQIRRGELAFPLQTLTFSPSFGEHPLTLIRSQPELLDDGLISSS